MSIPPVQLRDTIEKTARYVLKNGAGFEERLLKNDTDDKFSFLKPDNQYHEYYKASLTKPKTPETEEKTEKVETKPLEKPDELRFLADLPPISSFDLEVVKLTALYVACNSNRHIDALYKYMEQRGNRSQFAFLKRSHSVHALFMKLVKQYQTVINLVEDPEKDHQSKKILESISQEKPDLFQKAYNRAVYEQKHKIEKKTEETERKNKQLHYASIDWQNFTLVAKVNFDAVDEVSELAVPLSRDDIMYRSLQARSKEIEVPTAAPKKEPSVEVPEQNEDKEQEKEKQPEEAKPQPKVPKGMKIKAAGESRLKRKNKESTPGAQRTIKCPITGKQIPEQEFDTHLRVLLRDPRYQEQKSNFMKKNFTYESNLTTDQVYENIKRLVKKRDLSEEEEEQQKRKKIDVK
ncbi:hypothetical protein FT663_02364 [Candidozyma haemuli var. vulneris]|uniref:SURP motif domain-containing protein n=1 Tax=Candidozyma haemuli TaxID=45357 RepID=A0A2V1AK65_9ASCO|nr:hypothetical protein CXQ85_000983 [[Candida] haemuloni]KAF3985929.1 hypothetical protein FT662_04856 [[Candida] haemuloni var. vulneris]KAF3992307.1 hypothetical protein FT663_02364 [[Candida] haemuloni var. vulneris]PVH18697.1 hypothetical protein CXQ85_000983 [[Candida] haemuloni]